MLDSLIAEIAGSPDTSMSATQAALHRSATCSPSTRGSSWPAAHGAHAAGECFGNYERATGWRIALGTIDGRSALHGFDVDAVVSDGTLNPDADATFCILLPLATRVRRVVC